MADIAVNKIEQSFQSALDFYYSRKLRSPPRPFLTNFGNLFGESASECSVRKLVGKSHSARFFAAVRNEPRCRRCRRGAKGRSPPSPYRSISLEPSADSVRASTRHKGLITHKFADLRRSRNVNMKYENEDGGNKSDVRGSVGSFMKASIIVLDGLLCLVAAVESHFALSSLSLPFPRGSLPRFPLSRSFSPFLSLSCLLDLSPLVLCFLIGDVDGNIRAIRTRIWFSHGEKALCLAFCSCRFDSR